MGFVQPAAAPTTVAKAVAVNNGPHRAEREAQLVGGLPVADRANVKRAHGFPPCLNVAALVIRRAGEREGGGASA